VGKIDALWKERFEGSLIKEAPFSNYPSSVQIQSQSSNKNEREVDLGQGDKVGLMKSCCFYFCWNGSTVDRSFFTVTLHLSLTSQVNGGDSWCHWRQ